MSQMHGTAAGSQDLLACETCGRHFAQDVLLRHEPICRKVFNKKRKTFNSLKQRLQGTEIPSVKKQPPPKKQPEKKSNWRQLHEDFINAIQSAKQATKAMKEGRPLPPPPPPSVNPGQATNDSKERTNLNKCCGITPSEQSPRSCHCRTCCAVLCWNARENQKNIRCTLWKKYFRRFSTPSTKQKIRWQITHDLKWLPLLVQHCY
ncbi:zinc finger C2HC domain-containing protein 1B isoform X2 [Mauremys mutica]|uniref:zinc finger C2HC domain-containing protein 1B isoform X2 n=1 Tax=Mauremys mutica TaxID=74926 RepID=UPI001D16BA27|nr:zinc finger C2HC domain-containing protein 1B isoform X2 [Mauremys mutica]